MDSKCQLSCFVFIRHTGTQLEQSMTKRLKRLATLLALYGVSCLNEQLLLAFTVTSSNIEAALRRSVHSTEHLEHSVDTCRKIKDLSPESALQVNNAPRQNCIDFNKKRCKMGDRYGWLLLPLKPVLSACWERLALKQVTGASGHSKSSNNAAETISQLAFTK